MGTGSKSIGKAKRRRKPMEEIVDYVVGIESWDFSYWVALNSLRDALDPYHEHRHVVISGRLLRPAGLKSDRWRCRCFRR
ncbi:hypothetical protein ABIB80_000266 [Bradyrhizobium sp. i1.15.2]|uniref:hypothetical protein n=1 Tax=Bradyrhizobium sp. i1.15.2 TaxID=3156362 RepID=UPI00339633B6